MYFDYLKEREGISTLKSDKGFITYEITEDLCIINDLYVIPEYRETKEAYTLACAIENKAREEGCSKLIGFVFPELKGSTRSMKVQLDFGFKLVSIDGEKIILQKEL